MLLTAGFRNFVVGKKREIERLSDGGRLLISGLDATTMHGHVAENSFSDSLILYNLGTVFGNDLDSGCSFGQQKAVGSRALSPDSAVSVQRSTIKWHPSRVCFWKTALVNKSSGRGEWTRIIKQKAIIRCMDRPRVSRVKQSYDRQVFIVGHLQFVDRQHLHAALCSTGKQGLHSVKWAARAAVCQWYRHTP